MAFKKPAVVAKKAKVVPIVLSKSRALQPWEQEMAEHAKKVAKQEQLTGLKTIGTRGGIMKIDDEAVEGNAIRCVVLASLHENQWYSGPFDSNATQVPACYAFGDTTRDVPDEDMHPHAQSLDKQNDNCNDCAFNKMGSAEQGRGKACKNVRRLALVTEDALESAADLSAAEIRLIKVPVMSTNNWAKYVHALEEDMQRTAYGVVTEVALEPDDKSQFKVTFEFQELVNFDQALYDAMRRKVSAAVAALAAPYPKIEEEEKPAPRGKATARAPVRQAVPAKKVAGKAKY